QKVSQKRECPGIGPETFGNFSLRLRRVGVYRPSEKREKARILRAFRDYRAICLRLNDWVAGAGGIEPPNGGIKIRCLTAWLRPNRAIRKTPGRVAGAVSSGNVGL